MIKLVFVLLVLVMTVQSCANLEKGTECAIDGIIGACDGAGDSGVCVPVVPMLRECAQDSDCDNYSECSNERQECDGFDSQDSSNNVHGKCVPATPADGNFCRKIENTISMVGACKETGGSGEFECDGCFEENAKNYQNAEGNECIIVETDDVGCHKECAATWTAPEDTCYASETGCDGNSDSKSCDMGDRLWCVDNCAGNDGRFYCDVTCNVNDNPSPCDNISEPCRPYECESSKCGPNPKNVGDPCTTDSDFTGTCDANLHCIVIPGCMDAAADNTDAAATAENGSCTYGNCANVGECIRPCRASPVCTNGKCSYTGNEADDSSCTDASGSGFCQSGVCIAARRRIKSMSKNEAENSMSVNSVFGLTMTFVAIAGIVIYYYFVAKSITRNNANSDSLV